MIMSTEWGKNDRIDLKSMDILEVLAYIKSINETKFEGIYVDGQRLFDDEVATELGLAGLSQWFCVKRKIGGR